MMRSYNNPPALVKLTLEALVGILSNSKKPYTWADIRKEISKADFVQTVINFNTDKIKEDIKSFILEKYINSD